MDAHTKQTKGNSNSQSKQSRVKCHSPLPLWASAVHPGLQQGISTPDGAVEAAAVEEEGVDVDMML